MLVVNDKVSASLGFPQANSIRRKFAGAFELRSLVEYLKQDWGDGVTRLPILYQMFFHNSQEGARRDEECESIAESKNVRCW